MKMSFEINGAKCIISFFFFKIKFISYFDKKVLS